jgi:hypothetical protein
MDRRSRLLAHSAQRHLGERRTDLVTAEKIRDALRARSVHAAAQALEHQQVDLATALRVLAKPEWRRQCG